MLASARPLADMLWLRETEAGSFDTPERRAALEARIGQRRRLRSATSAVRKYYRQDLAGPAARAVSPRPRARPSQRARSSAASRRAAAAAIGRSGGRIRQAGARRLRRSARAFGAARIVRGSRSALPPREALILLAVLNHPWLLDSHAEELAELEFLHPDADQLRRAILDAAVGHARLDAGSAARRDCSGAGLRPVLARVELRITHASDWPARAEAAAPRTSRSGGPMSLPCIARRGR